VTFLRIVCWILLVVSLPAPPVSAADRPNLIVILVDDLGWQDMSLSMGTEPTKQNLHFRTPNLERFAQRATIFTQAYASTVCSPTRTSLLTGLNAARHRVTNWTLYPDQETSHVTPRLEAPLDWRREGLQPTDVTLPRLLRDRLGYRTIHVGKAHWGAYSTEGSDPQQLGFDVNIAGHAAGGPGHYHGMKNYGNLTVGQHTPPWGVPGLEKYHGTQTHLTDALTMEAARELEEAVARKQPFFLYLAHYAVHAPIQPHSRFVGNYRGRNYPGTILPIPEVEVNYASMVEGYDASLGIMLESLEQLGVAEDTIVVFLSDNGGLSRHSRGTTPYGTGRDTHCWPLREGKGSAYEGGTRIPLVVGWAKLDGDRKLQRDIRLSPKVKTDYPVLVEDLFPTLLTFANGGQTPSWQPTVDGSEFASACAEPSTSAPNRPLVFHYPHQWTGMPEGGYQPHSAIRWGDWKAIFFYESSRWELYNLVTDLGEQTNVADVHAKQLAKLAARLNDELLRMKALWPVDRVSRQPVPLRLPDQIPVPGVEWEQATAASAGLTEAQLRKVAAYLGGRGCVTHDGRMIYSWGDIQKPADVASAVKPMLTHLLVHAVESGRLPSFETPVFHYLPQLGKINAELNYKDTKITFRHCAYQTACYGVRESPGEAFDYNDFQMAMFFDALVNQVYSVPTSRVDRELLGPVLTDPLACQDHPSLLALGDSDRAGRLRISPRDFCRFGLLYLRDGNWGGKQLISPDMARLVTRSPLAAEFPRTQAVAAEMLPNQRSLGSMQVPDDQTDHFGSYSWLWWVNGKRASGERLWPDAPEETFACLGHKHGMRGMAVIPAWQIVLSWNDSTLDQQSWDAPQVDPHPLNEVFRLLRPQYETAR
jgi:arylsulfatase A-like enzyme